MSEPAAADQGAARTNEKGGMLLSAMLNCTVDPQVCVDGPHRLYSIKAYTRHLLTFNPHTLSYEMSLYPICIEAAL